MESEILKSLEHGAQKIAEEYGVAEAAVEEAICAEVELLAMLRDAVEIALPAVSSRIKTRHISRVTPEGEPVIDRETYFAGADGLYIIGPGPTLGGSIVSGWAVYLASNGQLVRLIYEGSRSLTHTEWIAHVQFVSPRDIVDSKDHRCRVEDVASALARAFDRQTGTRDKATAALNLRAARLHAICTLLRKS